MVINFRPLENKFVFSIWSYSLTPKNIPKDFVQNSQLLISINWISSTKEMNPIKKERVKIGNTAKLQSS